MKRVHSRLSLPTSLVFLLISVKADKSRNVWRVSATIFSVTGSVMAILGIENQVLQVERG
jgi:hypothetical protein